MRRILFATAAVALFGLMACSGNESTSSITAPTAVRGAAISTQANEKPVLTATLIGPSGQSKWEGDTMPTTPIATGHPGHVTMSFDDPLIVGATLAWSNAKQGTNDECKIVNVDTKAEVMVGCGVKGSGTNDVYPSQTTTYKFMTRASGEGNDKWTESDPVTVMITKSISGIIGVTWEPRPQGPDDPTNVYKGSATGDLAQLQVNADGQVRCGFGGGMMYNHFHATMTFVPPTGTESRQSWFTTYTAKDTDSTDTKCFAAAGTVSLFPSTQR